MLLLLIAAIQVPLHPVPQTLQRIHGSAQISFAVDRTQFVFPSTCATVKWKVEHIKEIYVLDRGVVGEGQLELCNGDAPILRVKLEEDVIHTYQLNRNVLMLQRLAAGSARTFQGQLLRGQSARHTRAPTPSCRSRTSAHSL